jgi:hypothetical protein
MQNLFHNITADLVDDESIRDLVERLWTEDSPAAVRAVVDDLLMTDDLLANAAVFELFSYSRTTWGWWLSPAFDGLPATLLARARQVLEDAWGPMTGVHGAVREPVIASAMHVVWRGVEIDDAALVLRALRDESDARVVFPALSAAELMVPLDAEFAGAVTSLLAPIAARSDLPPITRQTAVEVLAKTAAPEGTDIDRERSNDSRRD